MLSRYYRLVVCGCLATLATAGPEVEYADDVLVINNMRILKKEFNPDCNIYN